MTKWELAVADLREGLAQSKAEIRSLLETRDQVRQTLKEHEALIAAQHTRIALLERAAEDRSKILSQHAVAIAAAIIVALGAVAAALVGRR